MKKYLTLFLLTLCFGSFNNCFAQQQDIKLSDLLDERQYSFLKKSAHKVGDTTFFYTARSFDVEISHQSEFLSLNESASRVLCVLVGSKTGNVYLPVQYNLPVSGMSSNLYWGPVDKAGDQIIISPNENFVFKQKSDYNQFNRYSNKRAYSQIVSL